jgi:hypothetical protein
MSNVLHHNMWKHVSSGRCTHYKYTSNYSLALEDGTLALPISSHFECQEFGNRDTKFD